MSRANSVGARILAAQASHCKRLENELAAAQASGAPAEELESLVAQELAARKRYQELAVDISAGRGRNRAGPSSEKPRPWWRLW
jgi:hypothetical protein